tara:strand:+ start:4771 stop:5346 length:576 start_codon:yes stop_codon:yes gene_type:complete
MNENECLVADWRTIGYQDGSQGRSEQWLERRGEACAEFGVAPNMEEYLGGRVQGLSAFCQPRRGFDMGLRGNRYDNVCPQNLEGAFLYAYQDGRGLRDRRANVNAIEQELNDTIGELDALDKQITADTVFLATGEITAQERIDLALNLKDMAERSGHLHERLPQIEADLNAAHYDLDQYRANIAQKYPGAV